MSQSFSSKQILISLGAMFLISSVSNAYNADEHVEVIKRRCSSLRSSDEVIGCFNNDITVLEQIRRRERQEARDAYKRNQHQQQAQRPSKPARQRPQKPVETDIVDRPVPAQKPAPQQPAQQPAPKPPVAQRPPAPVPVAPTPAPANPTEQPALITQGGSAPSVAKPEEQQAHKTEGDSNRIRDGFTGRESDNVSFQVDGQTVTWEEFKKHREQQAAAEAAKADEGQKVPDGIIVDDSGKYSDLNSDDKMGQDRPHIMDSARTTTPSKEVKDGTKDKEVAKDNPKEDLKKDQPKVAETKPEVKKPEAKKDQNWVKDAFKDKRESKNVTDLTKQKPEEKKESSSLPGITIDDSGKHSSLKPDDKLGQDRPYIMDSARTKESAKTTETSPELPVRKPADGVTELQKNKKADSAATAEKTTNASGEGKVCHSGGDQSDYHCHEGVTEIEKPKRDAKAEEAAAKAAEAGANGDSCAQWKSPMRGNHRMTDCIGSKRNGSRKHAGIDLGNGQQPNTPIYSVGKGKVIQAGWMGGYGCVIQIQHDECPGPIQAYPSFNSDKCVSFYAHLQPAGGKKCPMAGKAGTQVDSCTKIGIMGGSGGNYAKHLHFEMRLKRQSGVRINPMVALGKEIRGGASNGNSNMCKSTESWLAATGMGAKTHSVKSSPSTPNRQAAARQ